MCFKMDLCLLGFHRFYHPEDADTVADEIAGRDYIKMKLAGDSFHGLRSLDTADLIARASSKLVNLPKWRRSESLQSFMDRYLVPFRQFYQEAKESSAYTCLMQKFTLQVASGKIADSDLQLAAAVATGKLREDPVVHGLAQSFLAMVDRRNRGCESRLNSSKYMDEDAILEMVSTLGSHREAKLLLNRFGVNERVIQSRFNFEDERLPQFFCSIRSQDILVRNFQIALSLFGRIGSRGTYLILDETVWNSTFEWLVIGSC